ncbi:hypothetical protein HX109_03525 [Galbibacter sp. BG1]|uniref:hypothetical protein n=1 Tax=Galbibacter sp. BG1 TaxID=1170699 RepID=UPI0015BC3D1C|nr:hypothetical protein [Galbibacter sp. BG1]QLE00013.1 hypothetical protein HX109_03525 [Galbibacter sp. BG1]
MAKKNIKGFHFGKLQKPKNPITKKWNRAFSGGASSPDASGEPGAHLKSIL